MNWKRILSLGAIAGLAWFAFRRASQARANPNPAGYLDTAVNPIAQEALGLAPLLSPGYAPFGFKFVPSVAMTPAIPLPVGWSGLFEGAYVPSELSTLEAR